MTPVEGCLPGAPPWWGTCLTPGGLGSTGEPFPHREAHFVRELRVESNALCRRRPAKSGEEKVVVAGPELSFPRSFVSIEARWIGIRLVR